MPKKMRPASLVLGPVFDFEILHPLRRESLDEEVGHLKVGEEWDREIHGHPPHPVVGVEFDLFVGIGDGESWDWLRDIEWRMPKD